MRLGIDVSKVGARDGIGSWTRGLVQGLAAHLAAQSEGQSERQAAVQDHGIERILLYDLAGGLDDDILRQELSQNSSQGSGKLGTLFESRLGRRPAEEPEGMAPDVFLAASWQIPAGWRKPLVFVVYDLTVLSHPDCHTVDNRLHTLEGCLQALVTDARFLAISEATADELAHHLDVPRSETAVVYPGLETKFAPHDPDDGDDEKLRVRLHDRFGLAPGYLLAVGSLEPRKNLERLVEAHGGLDDDLRRHHPLVVVGGGGWHNESLDGALRAAEARGDVHRMGRVTADDLVSLYRGAALFAYPSLAEGFGLPVLEAMACGTPVLTSDRSSMPEVAGDAARLVDPYDVGALRRALSELLSDEDTLADLSGRGLERARDFSWSRAAAEIVDLCHSARKFGASKLITGAA